MATKFYTTYNNRPPLSGEKISQVSLVERVGFVSAEERIAALFLAGKNLELYRASQYDYDVSENVDIDSAEFDLTRQKSFDFAEAFTQLQFLKYKTALVRRKKDEKETDKKGSEAATPVVDSKLPADQSSDVSS